mmetsp:Transcript_4311/g.10586  ORF Transcript_4311/g.10586 Transcript_4311/m.10586 type:complete len:101 (-) Transcript_4311:171-473(-)|eukprot:CAMPEP_0174909630 /NCGR_PEP_ID=MMETSP0167-20121228/69428_1 /TAXON_ID=38298 /ORGANISM="Rhodella maculata, Strain CCMP736" /LENGTH=100 /DNA_ID=CAMNT_0016153681 /DNA_START=500 /DNA_END=802 /DNA_ORIENTATION=+
MWLESAHSEVLKASLQQFLADLAAKKRRRDEDRVEELEFELKRARNVCGDAAAEGPGIFEGWEMVGLREEATQLLWRPFGDPIVEKSCFGDGRAPSRNIL